MKKTFAALALSLLAAVSLAQAKDKPDREDIEVEVVNGKIVVNEETAHTTEAHGAIVWRIVQPGYRFAANGIHIDSKGKHHCAIHHDGKRFRCAKMGHEKAAKYKYDVRVVERASGTLLPVLDPYIQND